MGEWITAPAGLYTFDAATGRAVPVIAVDQRGWGLLPGGSTTRQIYMVGAPQGDPEAEGRAHRDGYMQAVRDAERTGTDPCPHGEPRGTRYCALCRSVAASDPSIRSRT
jgi:hypothetical protein